jgi:XTP/dITP diphosphohydrolase
MTILLASSNAHKAQELQDLFSSLVPEIVIRPYTDVIAPLEIIEDGSTFAANALIKAERVFVATGYPTLADDSGLSVDALAGAPGVRSARYSADGTDASNRTLLLEHLRQVPLEHRSARFECVLCYVDGLRTLWGEGTCEGTVALSERGDAGFGYDPVFLPNGHERSFAEMSRTEKDSMSHRGAAARAMATRLTVVQSDIGDLDASHHVPMRDAMIHASVAIASGNAELLREALLWGVDSPEAASFMYEAILQSYLFTGFPLALDAMLTLYDTTQRIMPGVRWPAAEVMNVELFADRGQSLCKQVYGSVYERMMERFEHATPELRSWLELEGYGKVLSRPGLPMVERELCIIAMLATLDRETQLHSHVRGALRFGALLADIEDCADIVTERVNERAGNRILSIAHALVEQS